MKVEVQVLLYLFVGLGIVIAWACGLRHPDRGLSAGDNVRIPLGLFLLVAALVLTMWPVVVLGGLMISIFKTLRGQGGR